MIRIFPALVAASILALALGGCGGEDGPGDPGTGGTEGAAGSGGADGMGGTGGVEPGGSGGGDGDGGTGGAGEAGAGGEGGTEAEVIPRLHIYPTDFCLGLCTDMSQGDTRNIKAEVWNQHDEPLPGYVVELHSEDESVVTVSSRGLVRGIAPGTARIVGTAGDLVGSLEFNVAPPRIASIEVSPAELTLPVGGNHQASALARDQQDQPAPLAELAWTTSNPLVATVTEDGLIEARGPGLAWIEVWASTGVPAHEGRLILTVTSDEPRARGMKMEAIAVGTGYVCGLASGGVTYCWGSNYWGELGRGFRSPPTEGFPIPATVLDGALYTSITSSSSHSCALESTNVPWCWGSNGSSELGIDLELDVTGNSPQPTRLIYEDLRFTRIGAGYDHTCALTPEGVVMCWGANFSGELGIDDDPIERKVPDPRPVLLPLAATDLAVGRQGTCALDAAGQAWCWGDNFQGTLGVGEELRASRAPVEVAGDHVFASIFGGGNHYCALTQAGEAHCWGENYSGQLGAETPGMRGFEPYAVQGDHRFLTLATGAHHSCGIDEANDAWCWGANNDGQLGAGTILEGPAPQRVWGGLKFKTISASNNTSCAITLDDEAFCWGSNVRGHLGAGPLYPDGRSPAPWPVFEP